MFIARAVLALALVAPEAVTERRSKAAPAEVEHLEQLIQRVVDPINASQSVEEFEDQLHTVVGDAEFPKLLAEIARLTMRQSDLAKLPSQLDSVLPLYTRAFGEDQAGRLRQLFDMSIEIADRSATLVRPGLENDLAESLQALELEVKQGDNEHKLRYLESLACGLAAAAVVEGGNGRLPPSAEVRRELINRWFEGTRQCLAAIDPIQGALDDALRAAQERGLGEELLRLAYSWREGAFEDTVLVVWLVFEDGVTEEKFDLISSPRLRLEVESRVRAVEGEHDTSIFYRAQLASEPGPAEELLAEAS